MINDRTEAIEGIKEMRLQEKVDKIKAETASRIAEFAYNELKSAADKIGVDMTSIEFSCNLYAEKVKDERNEVLYVNCGVQTEINIKL